MSRDNWEHYDHFKRNSGLAEKYYGFVHASFAEGLHRVAQGRRFRQALDVACGSGDSTALVLPHAETVCGIDLSPGLIEKARTSPGLAEVEFLQGDFLACDLPRRYDLITAAWFHDFLHDEAQQHQALAKITAALAEGGAVVFLIPSANFMSDKAQACFRRLGWRQSWHEHRPERSHGLFSFQGSPWAEITCWQPLYLFRLYHAEFELHFLDTKKICIEQGFAGEAFLEPTFDVLYGFRRQAA
ncbi:MAG: hypothetical protein BWK76_13675 [Desulfobulbaceae bacterium A2]|nr:MAG: hypothetical protein BWK76_13675 [Desulfobulbaceae bacterium A2]